VKLVRNREFKFSTSELHLGVLAIAQATASNTRWNLSVSLERSRFQRFQYAGELLDLRCRRHAWRDCTDVEHIAVAGRAGQRDLLPDTCPLSRVGNRVVGVQALRFGVQHQFETLANTLARIAQGARHDAASCKRSHQMHAPGVAVAVRLGGQQIVSSPEAGSWTGFTSR
jgi:hypothetical protein